MSEGRDPSSLRLSLGLFTVVGQDERDLRSRWSAIREALPAGVADALGFEAVAAEGLAGTPDQVLERIGRFADLGVTELIVSLAPIWFALPDPSMLDLFAEAVLPGARGR